MTIVVAVGVIAFGICVGVLSAIFGVGGGLLTVPFMVLALGQSQHLAEGTSLLVIIPTAIAGVLTHHEAGFVRFREAGLLALGGVPGAFAGSSLALQLETEPLQKFFAAFFLLMAARMIWQGVKGRTSPSAAPAPDGPSAPPGPDL